MNETLRRRLMAMDRRLLASLFGAAALFIALEAWLLVLRAPLTELRSLVAMRQAREASAVPASAATEIERVTRDIQLAEQQLHAAAAPRRSDDDMVLFLIGTFDRVGSRHGVALGAVRPGGRWIVQGLEAVSGLVRLVARVPGGHGTAGADRADTERRRRVQATHIDDEGHRLRAPTRRLRRHMMHTRPRNTLARVAWAAILAGAGAPAAAADAPARHDPFARPNLSPDAAVVAPSAHSAPAAEWRPQLRAIVLAGERSMVKVGAVVVQLGDEVDGDRLVKVAEGKAVFAKGRRRVELTMGGDGAGAP
jgi:hypothetical protein